MSQSNTGTFTSALIVASIAIASSDAMQQSYASTNGMLTFPAYEICEKSGTSGDLIAFYSYTSGDFVRSMSMDKPIEPEIVKMQQRHKAIEDSFFKYSNGFPSEKREYIAMLANSVCKLQFVDNISSYNESDFSIDTILELSNGLKLSISQFLDEDMNGPVVFSVHRGKTLLVSDEMPIVEIVNTINSVEAKLSKAHEA